MSASTGSISEASCITGCIRLVNELIRSGSISLIKSENTCPILFHTLISFGSTFFTAPEISELNVLNVSISRGRKSAAVSAILVPISLKRSASFGIRSLINCVTGSFSSLNTSISLSSTALFSS